MRTATEVKVVEAQVRKALDEAKDAPSAEARVRVEAHVMEIFAAVGAQGMQDFVALEEAKNALSDALVSALDLLEKLVK